MSCGLNNPGQGFLYVHESQFCQLYNGISYFSLKGLRRNICIPLSKVHILAQTWESIAKRFPVYLPFWRAHHSEWWENFLMVWVLPKSTMLKSISGWAPNKHGTQETLTSSTYLRLILSVSCLHSFRLCLELLGHPCFIPALLSLSVWLTEHTATFSLLLLKSGVWALAASMFIGCLSKCRITGPNLCLVNWNLNFSEISRWFNVH